MRPQLNPAARALLDVSEISRALATPYWRVSLVDEIDSTQSALRASSPTAGDVLVTEFQSAGRGRLDRTFSAAKGSALLFSFYIEPTRTQTEWGFIPLLAGLSVAQVLNTKTHSDNFSTKWPNDILVNGKKVAGLLAEVSGTGVIVGIGINVSMTQEELPVPTATSLYLASGENFDRNALLADLLNTFLNNFQKWESGADLRESYRALSSTLGSQIEISRPDGTSNRGSAIDIDLSGALVLAGGEVVTVGDISHIR